MAKICLSNSIKFHEIISGSRVTKFVKTKDDFFPNFKNNEVCISLFINFAQHATSDIPSIIVSVWGEDDTGYEKKYEVADLKKAVSMFNCIGNGINKSKLLGLGFKPA